MINYKYLKSGLILSLLIIILCSCYDVVQNKDSKQLPPSLNIVNSNTGQYKIDIDFKTPFKKGFGTKGVDTAQIDKIDIKIKGIGMTEISLNNQDIGGAINVAVPFGNNRIITVKGKNSSGQLIEGAEIKNVFNSGSSGGTITINWTTTPVGKTVERMIDDGNGTSNDGKWEFLADKLDSGTLWNYINNLIPVSHPALVNTASIADYIKNNNGAIPPAGNAGSYVITPGVIKGTVGGLMAGDTAIITASDPTSTPITLTGNGTYTFGKVLSTGEIGTTSWKVKVMWGNKVEGWTSDYNIDPISQDTGTINGGQEVNNINFTFYWPTPAITNYSCPYGSNLIFAGDELVWTGMNLHPGATAYTVTLNTLNVTPVIENSTKMKVIIPSNATAGNMNVKLGTNQIWSGTMTNKVCKEVVTYAGTGTAGNGDGARLSATFNSPRGLSFDSNNNMYIADYNNSVVRKIDTTTGTVSQYWNGYERNWGRTFCNPIDLSFSTGNRLFVTDRPLNAHLNWGGNNESVSIAGTRNRRGNCDCSRHGCGYDRNGRPKWCWTGRSTNAVWPEPRGVTIKNDSSEGYVATWNNGCIKKFYVANWQATWTGTQYLPCYQSDNWWCGLNGPYGLALSESENALYMVEKNTHRIWRSNLATSENVVIAGTGSAGYKDGIGSQAQFNSPSDIAVGPDGILFVTDSGNNRIRRVVNVNGQWMVSTIAGTGTAGFADGSLLTQAQFNNPEWLGFDNNGYLYVSDTNNNRIRKIQ